jgi:hypothetical protein
VKSLALFAGLHKTGSTTIQQILSSHRKSLEHDSILYPLSKRLDRLGTAYSDPNHSIITVRLFGNMPDKQKQLERRQRFAEQLQQINHDTLIFAAEEISRLEPANMLECSRFFRDLGYSVSSVAYIRHIRPWIDSIVAQRIAGRLGPKWPMEKVFAEFQHRGGFVRPLVEALRHGFPEIQLLSFDALIRDQKNLAASFMTATGLGRISLPADQKKTNERTSDAAVRFLNFAYTFANQQAPEFRSALLKDYGAIVAFSGKKFQLTDQELAPYMSLIQSENEWLGKHLAHEFYDDQVTAAHSANIDPGFLNHLEGIANTVQPETAKTIAAYMQAGSH